MIREQVYCSLQNPLPTTGICTRDLWLRSLDFNPLDQPAIRMVMDDPLVTHGVDERKH
jgi:hypothetical protein